MITQSNVFARLREFKALKKQNGSLQIGLLGCMAERIKEQLLNEEEVLDFIAGPDAYRQLPKLIKESSCGTVQFDVTLSKTETYEDIIPIRYDTNGISAFVSIMRGCNNFCSYCIVPYTRGRERSREPNSILQEIRDLVNDGYKEVTLLGQNVNSYYWKDDNREISFANLVEEAAKISPELRVRFATSHPKDISDELYMLLEITVIYALTFISFSGWQ